MSKIKGWKKVGKKTWFNKTSTTIKKIIIRKPHFKTWGKYEVEGIRTDNLSLSLNALYMTTLETKEDALIFAINYMKKHSRG